MNRTLEGIQKQIAYCKNERDVTFKEIDDLKEEIRGLEKILIYNHFEIDGLYFKLEELKEVSP